MFVIFSPCFFDPMEHLPTHLPYEMRLDSPVQCLWMYPFEKFDKFPNSFIISIIIIIDIVEQHFSQIDCFGI